MARISRLTIREDIKELQTVLKKQTMYKNVNRIQALIYIKENRFSTRLELSSHLGITKRCLENWLSSYRKGGINQMLISGKRNRTSNLISKEIHEALKKRVMNSNEGFSSYVEAKSWIASTYGLELKYNTVREHLIRHFKTKIKQPRKSHVKKDKQAVAAFLKTT